MKAGFLVALLATIWLASPAQSVRIPVIVELFTSEGCSSCPPADDLLRRLIDQQPMDGVEVIGLSEHVDYWDRLGWRDPFSSARFTNRQNDYARIFGEDRVYTPQAVIDGRFEMIGSDAGKIRAAIADAVRAPRAVVDVAAAPASSGRTVAVSVTVRDVPSSIAARGDIDVVVAAAESGLVSEVKRGENARRTLRHSAVARSLEVIASLPKGATAGSFAATVKLNPSWTAGNIRIVAFVQHRRTRQIHGAGSAAIRQP